MKNITLSADEGLIEAARERARSERTTLNEQFRLWLANYARREQQAERAMETIRELRGKLRVGRKLTRDEMNERRVLHRRHPVHPPDGSVGRVQIPYRGPYPPQRNGDPQHLRQLGTVNQELGEGVAQADESRFLIRNS